MGQTATKTSTSTGSLIYIVFGTAILASALGTLAQTALNSMIVGIGAEFGVSEGVCQWLATIYMLTVGVVTPLVAFLSRKLPLKTMLLLSLAFNLSGDFLAMIAPAFPLMFVACVLQACGTGIGMPMVQTIAMTGFPPGRQSTALGFSGIFIGFCMNIGPVVGDSMLDLWGWRSFYVACLAIAVVLVLSTTVFVRKADKLPSAEHLDVPSFALSAIGFGGLLLGLTNASSFGLLNVLSIAPIIAGAICLALFVRRQGRISNPLVSMSIFKDKTYRAGFLFMVLLYSSYFGISLIMPMFMQNILGTSAMEAGFIYLPNAIISLIFNPLSGILCDKIGHRPVLVTAAGFMMVGALVAACMNDTTPVWIIMVSQILRGIGNASLVNPCTTWLLSKLTEDNVMDGSVFNVTSTRVAGSLGTAAMMFLITFCESGKIAGATALMGFQAAFIMSAVLAFFAFLVVVAKVK